MRLREIVIRNYRQFADVSIEFGDGLIAVIGENGAGKTTLIEAIFWALFGKDAAEVLRGCEKEKLRKDGATGDVVVSLGFEIDGDNYRVERTMKFGTNKVDAKLWAGPRLRASGNDYVTKEIISHVGMGWNEFCRSVYSPQKEIDALSGIRPQERKKFIAELLGVNVINEKIIPKIRADLREKENELKFLRHEVQAIDEENKEKELETLLDDVRRYEEKMRHLAQKVKEASARYEYLKGEVLQLEKKKEEYIDTSNEVSKIEHELRWIEEKIKGDREKLQEIAEAEKELHRLNSVRAESNHTERIINLLEDAKAYQQRREEKGKSISRLEEKIKEKKERIGEYREVTLEIDRVKGIRSELEHEEDECNNELKDILASIKEYNKRRNELTHHIKQIEELGPEGVCPTCERRLDEHYDLLISKLKDEVSIIDEKIKEVETQKRSAEIRAEDIRKRKGALDKKEKSLERKIGECESLHNELRRLEGELDAEKKELLQIEKECREKNLPPFDANELESAKKRYTELQKLLWALEECKKRVEKKGEIEHGLEVQERKKDELTTKIHELKRVLEGIKFNESEYNSLKDEKEKEEINIKRMEKELHEMELESVRKKNRLEALQKEIEDIKEKKKKIDQLTEDVEVFNLLENQMKNFWEYMMSYTRPILADYTSSFLSEILDYERVELDENYNIMVYRGGSPRPIEEYSGGEQDVINLCLRIALARLICELRSSTINLIVLDEVFGSLDATRRNNLLGALNILAKKFSQVILITHVEEIKESIGSYIAIKKSGDSSIIEIV